MKARTALSTILVVIIAVGIVLIAYRLTRPTFSSINQELEYIVADTVRSNKHIKNCAVFVKKGNNSFTWAGATGIARQDGQVPMSQDTPIYLASITKLFTAAVIMRLYEQGALSLNDPMAQYLPDDLIHGIHVYQGHDYSREITIEQLLAHTSGIADYYSEKAKDNKTIFEIFVADPNRKWTVEETIDRSRNDMTPNFEPGTAASYSDTNFQLLGKIIESITGKPLEVAYDEVLFRPLGLTHSWLVGRSDPEAAPSAEVADVFSNEMKITGIRSNGSYWADGGIVSTAEDAVIFLQALNEGKVISKDTLTLMHKWHKIQFPLQYGYGTMYFELPRFLNMVMKKPSLWGHSGSTGSFLYYAEDLDLYMAGSINQTESNSTPFRMMLAIMKAITDDT